MCVFFLSILFDSICLALVISVTAMAEREILELIAFV